MRSSLVVKNTSKMRNSHRKLKDVKHESVSGNSPAATLSWGKQSHQSEDGHEQADGEEVASIGSKYARKNQKVKKKEGPQSLTSKLARSDESKQPTSNRKTDANSKDTGRTIK